MNIIISVCHFCEIHGPIVLFNTHKIKIADFNSSQDAMKMNGLSGLINECDYANKLKKNDFCEACNAFTKLSHGLKSIDKENNVIYISNKQLYNASLNQIVQQNCVRSISCEQIQSQNGQIYFEDDNDWYVYSYKFSLKDFHSRGFKRGFSLNLLTKDKIFLLNSWTFLTEHFKKIINFLKFNAEKVFNDEHLIHGNLLKKHPMSPASELKIKKNLSHNKYNKNVRSLVDITSWLKIFEQLHVSFVSILHASSLQFKEIGYVKPNIHMLDIFQEEETNDGFINVHKKEIKPNHVNKIDTIENKTIAIFSHIRTLLKVLSLSVFQELLHHVLIGNQLVIRSKDKILIKSLIDCLKSLLPSNCCQIAYYTDNYLEYRNSNFIGMPLTPLLPDNLNPCLVIDISGIHSLKKISKDDLILNLDSEVSKKEFEELQLRYYMITTEQISLPSKTPTILEKIEKILLNESLDNSVVDLCLLSLKEEWLSISKSYGMFMESSKSGSKVDETKLLQILGAKVEDKRVLMFWLSGQLDG